LNSLGSNNIALGYGAGYNLTTGSSNIDIGNLGLSTDTNIIRIGSSQTQTYIAGVINGSGGGLINLNAGQLTSIGNTSGNNNFFVGPSGNATTSGSFNTAHGDSALLSITSGSDNTAVGRSALTQNTTGSFNTALGLNALAYNTAGSFSTAIGANALAFCISSNNIALGNNAGINITGTSNIDIGNSGLASDNNIIRIGTSQAATFLVGRVAISCTNPIALLTVGNALSPAYCDGTTWVNGSDRNAKEDFSSVDPQEVLAKVAALPLTEWQYKATPGQSHLGPMAQDFHAAFGLNGTDDKHISTVDEGGVALAAIQGLNQKLETENAELKARLDKLERLLQQKTGDNAK
jgi:hypothetical protein